jgi:uncharacterized protein (TIGR02722 family)
MTSRSLLAFALAGGLAACSGNVTYEDPEGTELLSTGFSYSDLNQVASAMTDSFLGTNAWGGDTPRVVFGGVENRTNQHIDTKNVTDTIRTKLIQSGKFTIVAGDQGLDELDEEIAYQQSGAVDSAAAAELGRQLGAEYVMYGRLTSIYEKRGDVQSVFYKFTLNAVNVQTRQIIWAEEDRIRKREERTLFGW